MANSKSLADLRTSVQGFLTQAKQASAAGLPQDPDNKGAAPMPADKDRAALDASTPGREHKNTPMVGTDDKAGLQVTNPGQGPAVPTRDGNAADSVTKLANLRDLMEKYKGDAAKAAATATATPAPAAAAPAAAPAAKSASEAVTAPSADTAEGVVTQEQAKMAYAAFASIGAALTSTEEGRAIVERQLQKQAGEARAAELLGEAVKAAAVYEAVGEQIAHEQMQEEQAKLAFAETFASLTPEQQKAAAAMADVRDRAMEAGLIQDSTDLYFFAKGAAAAEAMAAEGPMASADPAAGIPGAGAEPSPEEIIAAVMEAVQSGQISEEDAKAMLAQYGIPWPGEGGGAEAPPMDAAEKAASDLLQSILQPA